MDLTQEEKDTARARIASCQRLHSLAHALGARTFAVTHGIAGFALQLPGGKTRRLGLTEYEASTRLESLLAAHGAGSLPRGPEQSALPSAGPEAFG